jgi:acetate kinase
MSSFILTLNSGSSSLKFALFDGATCVGRGGICGIGATPKLSVTGALFDRAALTIDVRGHTATDATHALMQALEKYLPPNALQAVGHRVVHGGALPEPLRVTPGLLAHLKTLAPLAPLHQPFNLEAIDLIARLHPDVPQIACFDTSFHTTIPPLHTLYALPRQWRDQGVRRYGFHGLSYEYIAERLRKIAPQAYAGRTIIAHLGNGASLCALKNGQSYDTSMGFSALDGLVMGTRPGTLDAGVILYFLQHAGLDEPAIEHMLYRESGLLGVSGISSDMQVLLASAEETAKTAIELFCLRLAREAGGLISMLGGLDAFVFTGGIGEHAAPIRARVAEMLGWTGMALDDRKNSANQEGLISTPQSPVAIRMIPTDEESVIARHVAMIL